MAEPDADTKSPAATRSPTLDEDHSALERHPDMSYPVDVAPSDLDDDSFFNTLRPGLSPVACWRLDDQRFEFDSSFVLPATRNDIARLAQMRQDFADCPATIFGHADPVGSDDYNKKLSGFRAKAVFALLTHEPTLWDELHDEHGWKLTSSQRIVQFLFDDEVLEPGDEPPPDFQADGKDTQAWRAALKRFQQKNGLSDKGGLTKATRLELYDQYMTALCQSEDGTVLKLTAEDFLGKGKGAKGKAAFQGCSEFNPAVLLSEARQKELDKNPDQRNRLNAVNRRVVLYFFPPGVEVNPQKWPCPRADEGGAGCKKRFWSDHETRRKPDAELTRAYGRDPSDPTVLGTRDTFACRFYDRFARKSPCEAGFREWIIQLLAPGEVNLVERQRMAGVKFEATIDDRVTRGVTDADGIVRVRARADVETLLLDLTIVRDPPPERKDAPKTTHVRLTLNGGALGELTGDGATVDAVPQRLRSLGFGPADAARWNPDVEKKALLAFKKMHDLPEDGSVNDKLRELYGS